MGADNLMELKPEPLAGDRGHTCQPWLSHGVLLGRSWCGKRKFFVFPTCLARSIRKNTCAFLGSFYVLKK